MVDLRGRSAADLVGALAAAEVRAQSYGEHRVRFVTHRDLSDEDVDRCIDAVAAWASAGASRSP
jgi:threonine aldolase